VAHVTVGREAELGCLGGSRGEEAREMRVSPKRRNPRSWIARDEGQAGSGGASTAAC
jgi:hypothetical protein